MSAAVLVHATGKESRRTQLEAEIDRLRNELMDREDELEDLEAEDEPTKCEHKAAYPMGPRWMHCIDCDDWWEAPKP